MLKLKFEQQLTQNEIRTFVINNNRLFLSFHDQNFYIYDIDLSQKRFIKSKQYKAHASEIKCILIDQINSLLYTGSADCSIFAWDLKTLSFEHNLIGHKD